MRVAAAVLALLPVAAHGASAGRRYPRGLIRRNRNVTNVRVAQLTEADIAAVPAAYDWSKKGGVSPIKDQGDCGSCWAFAATETVESAVFMSTGKVPVLSVQQIVSCATASSGCDGGDQQDGYEYIEKVGGIDTEDDYPYKSGKSGKTGKCSWDGKKSGAKVTGFGFAIPNCEQIRSAGSAFPPKYNPNETALAAALVKYGPLSISVETSGWDDYKSGVANLKCSTDCDDEDHSPQLVGYDKEANPPYWKVRNSWGESWGENGYIRLPWGVNACGLAAWAQYVEATM